MKKSILIILVFTVFNSLSQTTADIFSASEYKYTYLGIDYSHAKFKGGFSQFSSAGSTGVIAIKENYFSSWNNVVNNERAKYSLQDALRKEDINYDLDAIQQINEGTVVEEMEGKTVTFLKEDIQEFIKNSKYSINEGVGIMFLAEYLDKGKVEACFHFVMFSMDSKEILIHERMISAPGGFGLKNYWIKPIYLSIQKIQKKLYKNWRKTL